MHWMRSLFAEINEMLMKKLLYIAIALLAVVSCIRTGLVSDVPAHLVKPQRVISLAPDTSLHCSFSEVLHAYWMQIVEDSILVLRVQPSHDDPYFFKAYSTKTFEFMGSFIQKGRGPGEMLSPHVVKSAAGGKTLYVNDNSVGKAYGIDVRKAIGNVKEYEYEYEMPIGILDWIPATDTTQMLIQEDRNGYAMRFQTNDGKEIKALYPYKAFRGMDKVTYLSMLTGNDGNGGKLVSAMVSFPQITIIDAESHELKSIAVDKQYKNWKTVLNSQLGPESIQYYSGLSTTQDYIFATYLDVPIKNMAEDGHGSSIHVFDWDGNFLYDIRVKESIEEIVFENDSKCLYCIEKSEDKIIRYDLSQLL